MLIDWFTVIAQILNFLLLVWLLKRFLYKPVLNAIDSREKSISDRVHEADLAKSAALKKQQEFQSKRDELELNKQKQIDESNKEAETIKNQLIADAKKEYEQLRTQLKEAIQSESNHVDEFIASRTRDEIMNIVRKVLKDLSDKTLEQQMIDHFISNVSKTDTKDLQKSLSQNDKIIVKSSFELDSEQKKKINSSMSDLSNNIVFETNPELICGIEMMSSGYKMAWSINDYLTQLRSHINSLLTETEKNII